MAAREDLAARLDREATRLRYLADRFATDSAEVGAQPRAELDRLDGVIRELDKLRRDLAETTQPEALESPRRATPAPDPSEASERASGGARRCENARTADTPRCGRWPCVCAAVAEGPWT